MCSLKLIFCFNVSGCRYNTFICLSGFITVVMPIFALYSNLLCYNLNANRATCIVFCFGLLPAAIRQPKKHQTKKEEEISTTKTASAAKTLMKLSFEFVVFLILEFVFHFFFLLSVLETCVGILNIVIVKIYTLCDILIASHLKLLCKFSKKLANSAYFFFSLALDFGLGPYILCLI